VDGSKHSAAAPAWEAESEHSALLLRLERLLHGRLAFTLVVLEYSDSGYRDCLMRHLDRAWEEGTRVDAREVDGDFTALEDRLEKAGREHGAAQVVGLEDWPHGLPSLWQAFNYHREQIADRCPGPLLLWVLRGKVGGLALEAPDFWAWRNGVFDFSKPPPPHDKIPLENRLDRGRATAVDHNQRIEEINAYLARRGKPSHSADLGLLLERGELLRDLGDLRGALESFQAAADGYERGDDRQGEALAKRQTADVLATQGNPAQALRILRQESLPVYEKLGDARSRTLATAKLGLLLLRQGLRDEAYAHLSTALRDAELLKIPEAEAIRNDLKKFESGDTMPAQES